MSGAALIIGGGEHSELVSNASSGNAAVLTVSTREISDKAYLEDSKQHKNAINNVNSKRPVRGHPSAMYQKSHAKLIGDSSQPHADSSLPGTPVASSEASGKEASADVPKTASTSQADKIIALNSVERERMANVEQIISQSG